MSVPEIVTLAPTGGWWVSESTMFPERLPLLASGIIANPKTIQRK
jgi:hypothetical protein